MAGPFYPPPPVFVGGRQPYAGKTDTVQQGVGTLPPRLAPIFSATLVAVAVSWLPPPPFPVGGVQPATGKIGRVQQGVGTLPPRMAAASKEVLSAVSTAWLPAPPLPQGSSLRQLPQPTQAFSQPIPVSHAIRNLIRAKWNPPDPQPYAQGFADVASWVIPPVISNPIPKQSSLTSLILQQWWPARAGMKYLGGPSDAGEPPAIPPDPPPPLEFRSQKIIADSWVDRSYTVIEIGSAALFESADFVKRGPSLEAVHLAWRPIFKLPPRSPFQVWGLPAPVPSQSYIRPADAIARSNWDIPWSASYLPRPVQIAPRIPAPIVPQWVGMRPRLEATLNAWIPPFQLPPTVQTLDPSGPAPTQAPGTDITIMYRLRALNEPPPYAIPRAGTIGSQSPPPVAPSQPQPVTHVTFDTLRASWNIPWSKSWMQGFGISASWIPPPPVPPYEFGGICNAQDAAAGGSLSYTVGAPRSVPYIPVRGRAMPFDALVRMVEGDNYSLKKKYPVYTFSNGVRTRYFTEDV